jgi:hypothetical protein
VTPHVAQNTRNRASALDERPTRHPGYAARQVVRKRSPAPRERHTSRRSVF